MLKNKILKNKIDSCFSIKLKKISNEMFLLSHLNIKHDRNNMFSIVEKNEVIESFLSHSWFDNFIAKVNKFYYELIMHIFVKNSFDLIQICDHNHLSFYFSNLQNKINSKSFIDSFYDNLSFNDYVIPDELISKKNEFNYFFIREFLNYKFIYHFLYHKATKKIYKEKINLLFDEFFEDERKNINKNFSIMLATILFNEESYCAIKSDNYKKFISIFPRHYKNEFSSKLKNFDKIKNKFMHDHIGVETIKAINYLKVANLKLNNNIDYSRIIENKQNDFNIIIKENEKFFYPSFSKIGFKGCNQLKEYKNYLKLGHNNQTASVFEFKRHTPLKNIGWKFLLEQNRHYLLRFSRNIKLGIFCANNKLKDAWLRNTSLRDVLEPSYYHSLLSDLIYKDIDTYSGPVKNFNFSYYHDGCYFFDNNIGLIKHFIPEVKSILMNEYTFTNKHDLFIMKLFLTLISHFKDTFDLFSEDLTKKINIFYFLLLNELERSENESNYVSHTLYLFDLEKIHLSVDNLFLNFNKLCNKGAPILLDNKNINLKIFEREEVSKLFLKILNVHKDELVSLILPLLDKINNFSNDYSHNIEDFINLFQNKFILNENLMTYFLSDSISEIKDYLIHLSMNDQYFQCNFIDFSKNNLFYGQDRIHEYDSIFITNFEYHLHNNTDYLFHIKKNINKRFLNFKDLMKKSRDWHNSLNSLEKIKENNLDYSLKYSIYNKIEGFLLNNQQLFENFEFKLLKTTFDIYYESKKMHHCLFNNYENSINHGQYIAINISSKDKTIAPSTLGCFVSKNNKISFEQIRSYNNSDAPSSVEKLAVQFISKINLM